MIARRILTLVISALVLLCPAAADKKPAPQFPKERMTPATRVAVIRTLNAERIYVRRPFPMGLKGMTLRADGTLSPDGNELLGLVTQNGASARPGDRAQITSVEIKGDRILFEINGGPRKKKKWWQHISISGVGGEAPLDQDPNPQVALRGSSLALVFDGFVPEIPVERVKELLAPVFDFTSHSAAQAYADSLPPKAREAIKNHQALVGMSREVVMMAKGRAPRKIREREGAQDYEEWIYGEPPQDVEFVRFVGDEVVRVEIMKVTGEKIVRTEREVTLEATGPKPAAAGSEAKSPSQPPSLRRPGEPNPGAGVIGVGKPDPRAVPGSPEPPPPTAPNPPPAPPSPQLLPSPAPAES